MENWRFVTLGLRQQNHDAQRLSWMISNSVVTVVSYLQDKMKIRRALFLSIQSSFFEDFMKAGILIYKDYVCGNKKGNFQKRNEPLEHASNSPQHQRCYDRKEIIPWEGPACRTSVRCRSHSAAGRPCCERSAT